MGRCSRRARKSSAPSSIRSSASWGEIVSLGTIVIIIVVLRPQPTLATMTENTSIRNPLQSRCTTDTDGVMKTESRHEIHSKYCAKLRSYFVGLIGLTLNVKKIRNIKISPQPFQCITYDPPALSLVGDWVTCQAWTVNLNCHSKINSTSPGNHSFKRLLHQARWINLPVRVQDGLRDRPQDLQHLRERLQNHEGWFNVRRFPVLRHQGEGDQRHRPGD